MVGLGLDHREDLLQWNTGTPDCYVTIDIGGLSNNIESSPSPRVPLQKTLSRKASQRGGGATERKVAEVDTTATNYTATGGGAGTCERSPLSVHVAGEQKDMILPRVSTPTAVGEGGGRCRRLGKRPSPWRDPRRVLLLFATLSSMGTLVLLYFILSMGKMASTDVDAH